MGAPDLWSVRSMDSQGLANGISSRGQSCRTESLALGLC